MSTQDTTHQPKDRPKWFGAALMLLALVLVGLLAWGLRVFIFPSNDEPAAEPRTAASQTAPSSASAFASATAGPVVDADTAWDCQADLNNDDVSIADSAPAVEEWVAGGYNVIPFSEFGGCEKRPSGLRVGFAHTEAGSLMAAATYAMALDPSVSEEAADDVEVAIAEGPDRDRLAEKAERIRDGLEQGSDGTASAASTLIGYTQDFYSEDAASYRLVYEVPTSDGLVGQVSLQADLLWEDGDWKLDPASGTSFMTSDLYQGQPYIEWGSKA
ncbi:MULTISPECIES: hypothetical protein [unclassified Arthrobacter]|uniref:hypothetical protein n=1 Tax=unclassified Arthrobacter TaxID=235627 RepID=UPI001490D3A2|nr:MULTISPECIES: hypothetical protein [unclassified Arthrobacter]MBE0010112.1 hypothetical protein [Arthrobacter sp. AET 35A]NOJ64104.1 hypothetical protein [Arthrobacter sp. 147(2020)]